jgi:branched-chain amino acid transport system ATP-binding protein
MFELFPLLERRRTQMAGTLSGGEQQQLAIARSLMSTPRLLMLDEPTLGLAPQMSAGIFELIASLRERGVTILLVEQDVHGALGIADRVFVLEHGEVTDSGTPRAMLDSGAVGTGYLGAVA